MKLVKCLLIFLMFSVGKDVEAQDNISILGTWKILAMYDKDIYYDFDKDSIWIKKFKGENVGYSKEFIDSTERSTKMMLKGFLGEMQVEFRKNNTCTMSESLGSASEGRYFVKEKEKILKIVEDGKDESTEDSIKYKLSDGKLVFLPGEDDDHTIVFKKQIN